MREGQGTKAKRRAAEEWVVPDFTYGVIDRCLLRTIAGEDLLVLTAGGMLAHVCGRVDAFARESGREIGIRVLRDAHVRGMNRRDQQEKPSNTEIASDCRQ